MIKQIIAKSTKNINKAKKKKVLYLKEDSEEYKKPLILFNKDPSLDTEETFESL